MMKNIAVIIPAYNEAERIGRTLGTYSSFFEQPKIASDVNARWIVVLNGCVDNTLEVVKGFQGKIRNLEILDIKQAGKGIAIKEGFLYALKFPADVIGFVDADMATSPEAFYDLLCHLEPYDGVIASRYMKGAEIFPPRPLIKRWGSRFIYEPLVWMALGLSFHDLQCGAKIFKRFVVQTIAPKLQVTQWAMDIEILYLCKKYGYNIHEVPTIWHDQAGSKLQTFKSGMRMLSTLFQIRSMHK